MSWKETSNLYIIATLASAATIAVLAAASLLVWHAVYYLTGGFILCPLNELIECIKTVCIVAIVTLLAPLAGIAGICRWLHHKERRMAAAQENEKGADRHDGL